MFTLLTIAKTLLAEEDGLTPSEWARRAPYRGDEEKPGVDSISDLRHGFRLLARNLPSAFPLGQLT